MNDAELFSLCSEVYERTGWGIARAREDVYKSYRTGEYRVFNEYESVNDGQYEAVCPIYTSDYLLKKLPKFILDDGVEFWLKVEPFTEEGWGAIYGNTQDVFCHKNADTPLKALLKLVLALDDAGVKRLFAMKLGWGLIPGRHAGAEMR